MAHAHLVRRAAVLALLLAPGLGSCRNFGGDELRYSEDMTGRNMLGISTGWAFVKADVDLSEGTGPLANPILGGTDVGSATTDLEPVFGIGLKYQRYITNNVILGLILERRIFNPDPTRPLNADVDIDDFATNHFIFDARYQFNPIDRAGRLRPFAGFQVGYVPEVTADGEVRYEALPALGLPAATEKINLDGSGFFTLGIVAGASYLLREDLTFDVGAFYEWSLDPTEDTLVLNPYPNSPPLNEESRYKGELLETGLYITAGFSWIF